MVVSASLCCFFLGFSDCSLRPRFLARRVHAAQLEEVPIERLIKNLTELADKKPKDSRIRFISPRPRDGLCADKTDKTQIQTGKEQFGAWFGYEPKHVPFSEVKKASNPEAGKKRPQRNSNWRSRTTKKPLNLIRIPPALLGYAWCLDQAGKKRRSHYRISQSDRARLED